MSVATQPASALSQAASGAAAQASEPDEQHDPITNGVALAVVEAPAPQTPQPAGIQRVNWRVVEERLSAAFSATEVRWRPGNYSRRKLQNGKFPQGTRIQMLPYIDARAVADRLDSAVGGSRWQDTYKIVDQPSHAVECGIGLFVAGEWVWKFDVGYPNAAGDDDSKEPLKAAYSDAFKRCAVKWGIGRNIYAMRKRWVGVDEDGNVTGEAQDG